MAKERVRKEVSQYAHATTGSSIVDRNIGIPEFLHLVRFSTLKQLKIGMLCGNKLLCSECVGVWKASRRTLLRLHVSPCDTPHNG